MQLVIAEKPSVAQSIAKVIGAYKREDGYLEGSGYIVSWCVGHLVELAQPQDYDEKYARWRIEDLPIMPQEWSYSISEGTAKQFRVLKKLMERSDVTELIEATDARNGYLYRCRITNAAGVTEYTQAATLRILTLEEQPLDATAVVGGNAYFTAAANVTEGIKYQWQYSRNGETWYNTTMEGYNTDTLTVTVTAARNGYRYRCVIIGSKNSQIVSQEATLLVNTNEA